jgi:hypothetical protein
MGTGDAMARLLDALQGFNRRERHILVGWVLDRLTFPLGHEFRQALSSNLFPDDDHAHSSNVPADSYVAMDYTLNWLAAALLWSEKDLDEGQIRSYEAEEGIELSDNSDTDLLIAFARGAQTHVVLLEAKGYTPWQTKQLKHKCERLTTIFGKDGKRFSNVTAHWVFVSPGTPPTLEWPPWILDPRTNNAGYWKIRSDRWPGPAH